ncbi:MAG: UDP-N-acetylglucosamine pyrophosphorylase [Planctomycetota bacterium]|nr:MAG: UDP-N-acetylglucosamine pyrophosphorylase [Planctomycetota bacterium]
MPGTGRADEVSETAAIILAAGKSTRMKSDRPKVLHEVCGRPMLAFPLAACRLAGAEPILIVVGHGGEAVRQAFDGEGDVEWVTQPEQKGTGHAVACCRSALESFDGNVLVLAGDMPLVRREPLVRLVEVREQRQAALSLATALLDDPAGYGRIVRDEAGEIVEIVEERDCTPAQREIREVNPSYYCFDAGVLFEAVGAVDASPKSGEVYLTDLVSVLRSRGLRVCAEVTVPAEEALGVNSRLDLAMVNRVMQDRIQLGLMQEGTTIVDPDNTWIEAGVTVGRDTVIHPFSTIGADAVIGERCRIGPFARIGAGEVVASGSVVEAGSVKGATT